MIGQTLHGYEILSELGVGGYGAVYLARDTSVNREVAIKVILSEHASNPDFIQRFESEARLVAQLEHPHIIPLYSFWQDEHEAFLVMRYVRGGTLGTLIEQQGSLPLSQIERWMTHLCDALSLSHKQGVVHRDLKPDNILLDDLGNAYLTDFGIAKQIQTVDKATATDGIMGTWYYLSPEQIQSQPVSPATDIYALGIILFEMLSGEHPFKDATATMIVMKHLQESLPSLDGVRPDLPLELDDIVQRATAKVASERYQTATDFLDDLKAALTSTAPVPGRNTTIPESRVKSAAMTQEERNRHAMLTNVQTFWIEGVLEQSLYNMVWIELGMTEKAEAVDNPWQTVLKLPDAPDQALPAGTSISDVFDRLQGKMLILGDPGSGKTITLLTLTRSLLQRAEWDSAHPIPVVFNLSSWAANRKPLVEWMVDELNTRYQVPYKLGEQWIAADEILPLLDGLDEVAEQHRNACVAIINDYRARHGFVDVVVCSRTEDYNALTRKLRLNGAIVLQPLQRQQVDDYLVQTGDGLSAVRHVLEDDEKLRRLTTSPLMLNILTLAYRDLSIDEIQRFDTLEGRRKHLFETYVNRMLERRGIDQPYSPELTRRYLAWLGKNMSQQALSVFHIERLQWIWLETARQRRLYSVGIRLPLLIVIPILLSIGEANTLALVVMVMILLDSLLAALGRPRRYRDSSNRIKLAENVKWSLSKQKVTQMFWRGVKAGVIFAAVVGTGWFICLGTSVMSISNISFLNLIGVSAAVMVLFMLVYGVIFGLIGAVTGVTFGSVTISEDANRTISNQGIKRSARSAITAGLISGGIISLIITSALLIALSGNHHVDPMNGLIIFLPLTIFFGLIGAFVYGGSSVFKHLVLRTILWRTGQTPFNMAKFLDYAASRILMRKVGGGYIFIHRMLLEYFAHMNTEKGVSSEYETMPSAMRLSDSDDRSGEGATYDDSATDYKQDHRQ